MSLSHFPEQETMPRSSRVSWNLGHSDQLEPINPLHGGLEIRLSSSLGVCQKNMLSSEKIAQAAFHEIVSGE